MVFVCDYWHGVWHAWFSFQISNNWRWRVRARAQFFVKNNNNLYRIRYICTVLEFLHCILVIGVLPVNLVCYMPYFNRFLEILKKKVKNRWRIWPPPHIFAKKTTFRKNWHQTFLDSWMSVDKKNVWCQELTWIANMSPNPNICPCTNGVLSIFAVNRRMGFCPLGLCPTFDDSNPVWLRRYQRNRFHIDSQ